MQTFLSSKRQVIGEISTIDTCLPNNLQLSLGRPFTTAVNILIMPRLTITVTDEQAELLEEKAGNGGEYESKSEAVRTFIREYERLSEQAADLEDEYEERIADLERENDRIRNEKQLILEQREENTELQRYVEDELSYRKAGLATRAKWWLFGKSGE